MLRERGRSRAASLSRPAAQTAVVLKWQHQEVMAAAVSHFLDVLAVRRERREALEELLSAAGIQSAQALAEAQKACIGLQASSIAQLRGRESSFCSKVDTVTPEERLRLLRELCAFTGQSTARAEGDDGTDSTLGHEAPGDATAALRSAVLACVSPLGLQLAWLRPAARLRIFHVNDVGVLDQLPAFKACVDAMGASEPNVLRTCAGDFLCTPLLSSLDHGRGATRAMNACGFDAVCFGSHEGDVPGAELLSRINELDAAWLSSNMPSFTREFEGSGELERGKCPPMRLVELRGGRSVVLIGLHCGGNDRYARLY